MSKGLEALENIFSHWNCCNPNSNGCDEKDFEIIEKELKDFEEMKIQNKLLEDFGGHFFEVAYQNDKKAKALEIIKEKRVNVRALIKSYYSKYGFKMYNDTQCVDKNEKLESKELTQEEYELLKEILL